MKIYSRIVSSLLTGAAVEVPISGISASSASFLRSMYRELREQEKLLRMQRHGIELITDFPADVYRLKLTQPKELEFKIL